MKKSIILFGGLLFLTTQSCDVLDKEPLDSISTQQYFANANAQALEQYCNDLYPKLITGHGNPNEYNFGMMETDFQSDDLLPWDANSVAFSQHSISTADNDNWKWENIRACNAFMQDYELSPETEAVKHRYAGEILFFKTLDYFNKVKRFGDVPWYEHALNDKDEESLMMSRTSRTEVLDHILADIDNAIAFLPEEKKVNEVTHWTALALKARICLYEGTFRKYHDEFNLPDYERFLNEAVSAADELMTKSGYKIYSMGKPESDYLNFFASHEAIKDEVILARGYSDEFQVYHNLNYYTMTASFGRPGLEKRLVNSYLMRDGKRFTDQPGYDTMFFTEEMKGRDPRLSQTVRTPGYTRIGENETLVQEFGSTVTGYQMIKFVTERKWDTNNKDINDMPLFRFAEALLIYAEAKAELGTLTQADLDKSVKLLRDRVDMPSINMAEANANPDPYLEKQYPHVNGGNKGVILEIRRERRIELVMESFRWDDMMRWKEGATFTEQFKGMYFPNIGPFDLDGDGNIDVCIYENEKPDLGGKGIQYLKLNSDVTLEHGNHGCIVVNPHIKKTWDEKKDYLYPIPIQERLLNTNLTQNPGWNDGI